MSRDRILREAASEDFNHYDPRTIIDAVNTLLPLGKEGALAAIESYLSQQSLDDHPQEGLFLVLRILFEVPEPSGYQPPLRLGGSIPNPPPHPRSLPHFPLVLIDDRPLMLVSGFVLGGDVQPVSEHIRHFRQTGKLRKKKLVPSESANSVLRQFQVIYRKAYGSPPTQHEVDFIKSQLN